ncbi:MAG: monofunctional biosynthetic peptidoglycan transglycosylase, partial [Deltaproteobacteria bacterium]|nr:monofunctional biosynthetic peptidoglycan transglycosylase [Deltaproteobacteria bacterium]
MPKKKKISGVRRLLKWSGIVLIIVWGLSVIQVFSLRFIDPPFTVITAWQWVLNKDHIRRKPSRHIWKPLQRMSPHLKKAVLAAEDQRFTSHRGFDFAEMNKAIKDMALKKGFRGASTIT